MSKVVPVSGGGNAVIGGGGTSKKVKTSTVVKINATTPTVRRAEEKNGGRSRNISPKVARNLSLLERSSVDYAVNVTAAAASTSAATLPRSPPPAPPVPPSLPSPQKGKITHFPSVRAPDEAKPIDDTKKDRNGTANLNQSITDEEDSNFGKKSPDPIMSSSSWHRKTNDGGDDEDEMSAGTRCCFGFLLVIAQVLLHGAVGLVLYWVFLFHRRPGQTWPFAWKEDPKIEFNLHPTLMILGFVYFVGQAMLTYRSCRCCCRRRRIWNKILHTVFHLAAIPCVVVGFIAVLDSHELRKGDDGLPAPLPNFYSLHSWMGLATMGLFALQFVAGFFSFLLLLCCESATASFRASLVPIHSAFGITTFVMAVATCCSGLTEKAFFTLSVAYAKWVNYVSDRHFSPLNVLAGLEGISESYTAEQFQESLVINTLGAVLVALVFVMPVILIFPRFRVRPQRIVTVTSGNHHHHNDRYA